MTSPRSEIDAPRSFRPGTCGTVSTSPLFNARSLSGFELRARQRDFVLFTHDLFIIGPVVMREICRLRVGALLQSARGTNQIRDPHVCRERIASWAYYFALHIDRPWISRGRILVHQHPVARTQNNVVHGAAV